jgi:hypothetical protein
VYLNYSNRCKSLTYFLEERNVIADVFAGNILHQRSRGAKIQSSTVTPGKRHAPHKRFTDNGRTPSTRPRHLADARLTAARIKWNRVIFCGRTKRWNSAGE